MHQIRVSIVSPEAADRGVAELWPTDEPIGCTILEDRDVMLCIEPRRELTAVVVGAQSLGQLGGEPEDELRGFERDVELRAVADPLEQHPVRVG